MIAWKYEIELVGIYMIGRKHWWIELERQLINFVQGLFYMLIINFIFKKSILWHVLAVCYNPQNN